MIFSGRCPSTASRTESTSAAPTARSMGSTYLSRRVTPLGVGRIEIATKIIYAVTAILVLCSVSLAAQQMFFDAPPKADEQQVVESTSATTAGGVGRRATRSHEGREGDESVDPEAGPARDPLRRGPATPREPRPPAGAEDGSPPTPAVGAH